MDSWLGMFCEYNLISHASAFSIRPHLLKVVTLFAHSRGLETNARPLARGELNSVRASGSSDLTSPVGEWKFYGDLSTIGVYRDRLPSTIFEWIKSSK